tara:strand:+ start:993 stop:1625 length:633 start_codon:yes stop_codon:yes gene_type:complete
MKITENRLKSLIRNIILESRADGLDSNDGVTYYPPEMCGLLSFRKEEIPSTEEMIRSGYVKKEHRIFKIVIGWHPPEGYENNSESQELHQIIVDGPYDNMPIGLMSHILEDYDTLYDLPRTLQIVNVLMKDKSVNDEKVGVFWHVTVFYRELTNYYNIKAHIREKDFHIEEIGSRFFNKSCFLREILNLADEFEIEEIDILRALGVDKDF